MSEECQPIFVSGVENDRPGVSFSTANNVMPRRPGSPGAGADDEHVGQAGVGDEHLAAVEDPAVVRGPRRRLVMPATSEPVPGSVTAIAATASPDGERREPALLLRVAAVADEVRCRPCTR